MRVTNAMRDSVFPLAAFGHEGNFGVLFRDDREGGQQNVYFTSLTCFMPGMQLVSAPVPGEAGDPCPRR